MTDVKKLPPEIESGNKEYKLKIIPDNDFRLEQLASQMKWRINEGNGIALYYIGIDDDGSITGISKEDFSQTMKNLSKIVNFIKAKIIKIDHNIDNNHHWYTIKINFIEEKISNSRVIFIGPSSSGKTTLISNIVNNISDDGNGKSRKLVFNHKHEIYSGRTSSISIEKKDIKCKINNKICINLIDTPGYCKYMKTTLAALMKYDSNLIVLTINPINIKFSELKFYLDLVLFLEKDFLLILSKQDLYKKYHKTFLLKSIYQIVGKEYLLINKIKIIEVDNLKKIGYNKLISYFKEISLNPICNKNDTKFQICDIMKIPNLGKIYTGILLDGNLEKNKKYIISNADSNNEILIKTIYFNDKPLEDIKENKLVTIQLEGDNDFCNKTDKLITNTNLIKKDSINVICNYKIENNIGICIYKNQYCVVNIIENNGFYTLSRKEGFVNLCKNEKIILKINKSFVFTNLID